MASADYRPLKTNEPSSSEPQPTPMNEEEEDNRFCRVCSDKSDGTHFGVDSCRACAAFFRRSVVLGKKYVCRQGGDVCNINKSVRSMCRKCRFRKCEAVGMLPENVHQRPAAGSSLDQQPSGSGVIIRPVPVRPVNAPPAAEDYPLLDKIFTHYTHMTSLRRSSELTLVPADSLHTVFSGANGELSPCTFDLLNKIMKAAVPIIADFCNQTFPEFAQFGQDEKWMIFRNFIGVLFHFECGFRTAKHFREDLTKRQITVTTFLDVNNYARFFEDSQPPMEARPELIKIIKDRSESALALRLTSTFMRLDLTDMELAAFVCLTIWSPNIDRISEEMHALCTRQREMLFRDLHNYYKYGMQQEEYAVRLGEFMSLFSNLQACTQKMREEMELFSLFEIFKRDSFVYHLLK